MIVETEINRNPPTPRWRGSFMIPYNFLSMIYVTKDEKKNFFLFGSYGVGGKHMFPYGNTGRITGHFSIDMVFYHNINLRLASDFEKQFPPCQ